MKKRILFISIILFVSLLSSCNNDSSPNPEPEEISDVCQKIFEGNVNLDSQQEVDDFVSQNYCQITGDLSIGARTAGDTDINDISGLSQLEAIGGDIFFTNSPQITSLNGLRNLTEIQGSLILLLKNLDNLTALSNITVIPGRLSISGNEALINLFGLSSLQFVQDLRISFNSALESTVGVTNLIVTRDLDISFNPLLETITPINSTTLRSLDLSSNAKMTDFTFLERLQLIERLTIRNNLRLESFNGLSNLQSITSTLYIENNELLTSFAELTSLESIGNNSNASSITFGIVSNAGLMNFDGLELVTDFTGSILIENNAALSDLCALQNSINNSNVGTVTIESNLFNPTATDIANGTNCSL